MSILPKKDNGRIDYKSMWEVKLLKGILLFFAYATLVTYLFSSAPSAWNWIKLKWYIGDDYKIEHLTTNTETLLAADEYPLAMRFIRNYPPAQAQTVHDTLRPLTPQFNADYFFMLANKFYRNGDIDTALFWNTVARFRLRYDAVRCQSEMADMLSNDFSILLTEPGLLKAMLKTNENDLARRLEKTLSFDEKHPPENNPRYFCEFLERYKHLDNVAVADPENWNNMRRALRLTAQIKIDSIRQSAAKPNNNTAR